MKKKNKIIKFFRFFFPITIAYLKICGKSWRFWEGGGKDVSLAGFLNVWLIKIKKRVIYINFINA